MNLKELKELILFLKEEGITEFELERGDVKVRVKRGGVAPTLASPDSRYIAVHAAPAVVTEGLAASMAAPPAPIQATPKEKQEVAEDLHMVRSPIVGTFYESPSPGAPPFVKPGDSVSVGQVLCIVEAMKLMNEIESDVAGELVKRLVTNGQPIEYGQELFAIRVGK
ncbi:MAG TPA: acetyl-CoA carboxylase biotin carboxyl carrier protein [Terriglobales bacterium]|nr:acetyl-CoA carboxylase biotin carboxyl carrier protein [Terriglobales bacterium]